MAALLTAPWSGQAMRLPVDSYGVVAECNLYVPGSSQAYPLNPTGATIDYQARRSPTVHLDLEAAWPEQATREILDPRLGLTVEVLAGYEFLDGSVDLQRMALLRVAEAEADHGAKTVRITADSDESIPIAYPIETAVSYTTSSTIVGAIQAVVGAAFAGETLDWVIGDGVHRFDTFEDAQDLTPGEDRWDYIQDWADSLGVTVWHDGLGTWHIDVADARPSSLPHARLRTGPRGTVTGLVSRETLDGYGNRVALVYEWTTGSTSYRRTAVAATQLTPRRMMTATKTFKPHNAAASARSSLLRVLRRGHSVEVSAASYLWTRPAQTLTVDLEDGTQERLLVERASFDLLAGEMTLQGQSADENQLVDITTTTTTTTL